MFFPNYYMPLERHKPDARARSPVREMASPQNGKPLKRDIVVHIAVAGTGCDGTARCRA